MLTYSSNASLDARFIVVGMFALSPSRGQVEILEVEAAVVVEDGLVGGEKLTEFHQVQEMMDA